MGTWWIILLIFLSGCSLEANLISARSVIGNNPDSNPNLKMQRTNPDFVAGEVVTTGNGVVIQGSFGEISEKKTLSNGVVFEGAFYE